MHCAEMTGLKEMNDAYHRKKPRLTGQGFENDQQAQEFRI